jgi:hypothetical protein
MPKFTPEEAEQILRESRETILRVDLHSTRDERREHQAPDAPVDRLPPIVETGNQRDARELGEKEIEWARAHLRRKREEDQERQQMRDAWARACADQRVGELESQLCEVVKSTTFAIESLEIELSRTTGENRDLKTKLAEVERSKSSWPNCGSNAPIAKSICQIPCRA